MAPRLGAKYPIEIQLRSNPRAHYQSPHYLELGLPAAPAVMVGDEVVIKGSDIAQDELEKAICRHLGLLAPQP